jgi:transcriptional regulator with XRE-family HTH domain
MEEWTVDVPADPSGEWWIDLSLGGWETSVAWRPGLGFGLFAASEGDYGERPDEIYRNPELAAERLLQLAHQKEEGEARRMTLVDARRLLGVAQTELASKLGVGQAAISRLENRHEAKLGTIVDYVAALGGELKLSVRFGGFEAPIQLPRPPAASDPSLGNAAKEPGNEATARVGLRAVDNGAESSDTQAQHEELLPMDLAASSEGEAAAGAVKIGAIWVNGSPHRLYAEGARRRFLLAAEGRHYSHIHLMGEDYPLLLGDDGLGYEIMGLKQGDIDDVFDEHGHSQNSATAI